MKNRVGQHVRGKNFYKRPGIIRKLYRRLGNGSNVYLSAPRRVGKTSIMRYLEDNPKKGYIFLYVNTESIHSTEDYFERLFLTLLNSEAINDLVKNSKKAKAVFDEVIGRVKKIGLWGFNIEIGEKSNGSYSDEFFNLMKKLETDGTTIVLMVDEFPATVENIANNASKIDAVQFLQLNRAIRQESAGGLLVIYTGSIGLASIVNRLDVPESINDLNIVEIPPLSIEEGFDLTKQLLESERIQFEESAIHYLLEKIEWLMPFFIQLAVQEIIDSYDLESQKVNNKAVDLALERIYNRRNNIHFDSYFNRLEDAFNTGDYKIAIQILNLVASEASFPATALYAGVSSEADKKRISSVLQSLEYDGYVCRTNGSFKFNSPILRGWWNRYIRN